MIWEYKDLKLHYQEVGNGTPVLMLHGYWADHRLMSGCMEPVFETTPKVSGYRRIYLDLPGMGATTAVSWIDSADCLLEVLKKFIETVIGAEKFIVVGESYGGYLTRGIIKKMADQIAGCMYICPCIIVDPTQRKGAKFRVARHEGLDEFLFLKEFGNYMKTMVIQTPHTWERYGAEILSGIKVADKKYLKRLQETHFGFGFELEAAEGAYDFPALFMVGKQDDIVGYEDAWDIHREYQKASFVALDQAGHYLQIDQEEIFWETTKNWFAKML